MEYKSIESHAQWLGGGSVFYSLPEGIPEEIQIEEEEEGEKQKREKFFPREGGRKENSLVNCCSSLDVGVHTQYVGCGVEVCRKGSFISQRGEPSAGGILGQLRKYSIKRKQKNAS